MTETDRPSRGPEAMVDEFDRIPVWVADAVQALGPDHALPATCRDCGGPGALDWLLAHLHVTPGTRLLDIGGGMGGPAAYAARTHDVVPLLVDPMPGACETARKLFLLTAQVADGSSLPWDDDDFDVAWCLGVLCTLPDKEGLLAEAMRVLQPGGRLGLLVYERHRELTVVPEGNHFTTALETDALLEQAGLVVEAEAALADVPGTPAEWREAADRVDGWIRSRHGRDLAWRRAREQETVLSGLVTRGEVRGRLLVVRARPA